MPTSPFQTSPCQHRSLRHPACSSLLSEACFCFLLHIPKDSLRGGSYRRFCSVRTHTGHSSHCSLNRPQERAKAMSPQPEMLVLGAGSGPSPERPHQMPQSRRRAAGTRKWGRQSWRPGTTSGESALWACPQTRPTQSYPPWEILVFHAANSQAASDVFAPNKQLSFVCKERKMVAWLGLGQGQVSKKRKDHENRRSRTQYRV